MPFISEELWQRLPAGYAHFDSQTGAPIDSICQSQYPTSQEYKALENDAASVEQEMNQVMSIVHELRSLTQQLQGTGAKLNLQYAIVSIVDANQLMQTAQTNVEIIQTLSKFKQIRVVSNAQFEQEYKQQRMLLGVVNSSCSVHVPLDSATIAASIDKLQKQLPPLEKNKEALVKQMSIPDYDTKVPATIKEKNSSKLAEINNQIDRIKQELDKLQKL